MDNQHKKITGCRDLTQSEIDGMNSIKALEAEVGELKRFSRAARARCVCGSSRAARFRSRRITAHDAPEELSAEQALELARVQQEFARGLES
nr:hypothetical protein FFPRI1PSEUD_40240 [Pseudomonas sp. FFPRI_1]